MTFVRGHVEKESSSFPRKEHLGGTDLLKVMVRGEKHTCSTFHVYMMPAEEFRAGVCVSRKLGGSVVRNKIKRILREAVRLNKRFLSRPCHLVLVAREGAESLSVDKAKGFLLGMYGDANMADGSKASK